MPLVKTNLDKLNFSKLYKIQMKNSTFKVKVVVIGIKKLCILVKMF